MSRFWIPQMHNTALGLQLRNQSNPFRHMCSGQEKQNAMMLPIAVGENNIYYYTTLPPARRLLQVPRVARLGLVPACMPASHVNVVPRASRFGVYLCARALSCQASGKLWAGLFGRSPTPKCAKRRRGAAEGGTGILPPSPARPPRESRGWGRARQAKRPLGAHTIRR